MLCAQWTCHVLSRLAYLILPFLCHKSLARVLVCFLSVSCVSYLYEYGLSTRLRLLVCSTFLLSSRRFVNTYCYCLCLSFFKLSTRLTTCYSWTADSFIRLRLVCPTCMFVLVSHRLLYIRVEDVGMFPIFNILCNHPKGVTCEIPRTLSRPL